MKLTFLGTGAADWDINAYTPGTEFRRFSSALVNDDLLIDPGPHILHFCRTEHRPDLLDHVKNIIVTHSHADHFSPKTVEALCVDRPVTLWGDAACMRKLVAALGSETAGRIHFVEIAVRRQAPYSIGGYNVWSLRSNHLTEDNDEITRLYLIEAPAPAADNNDPAAPDRTRLLFYGCDSAWLPTETWNVMRDKPVNALVLELTCGEPAPDDWRIFEHNTLDMLKLMLAMFRKYGCFAPDVRYYTSHMARTLHTGHAALVQTLAPLGVTPAYDGLEIEI